MASAHTKVNLATIEDAAVANGFSHRWEARVARVPLQAAETGVTHFRLQAGKRSPFSHRHRQAEEIYVVLAGHGRMKLDDEIISVGPLDAIRVAPQTARAFEAGPEGLEFLAVGRHYEGEAEGVEDPWVD
jgi:mannose-6-phosphate isomerase-like protein (cupin superfamily)